MSSEHLLVFHFSGFIYTQESLIQLSMIKGKYLFLMSCTAVRLVIQELANYFHFTLILIGGTFRFIIPGLGDAGDRSFGT